MAAERYEPETAHRRWTNEEYLAFERAADEKHEMFDGRVFLRNAPQVEFFPDGTSCVHSPEVRALAGASLSHNCIVVDTVFALKSQLRGSACQIFANDLRVQLSEAGDYAYLDVVVACEPELAPGAFDVLLNPTVVIEVLSPTTEESDRADKWVSYRKLPSLREYVLISASAPRVEVYSRRDDSSWLLRIIEGLQENVALESIEATLSLAEVYERVTFETREYSQETS